MLSGFSYSKQLKVNNDVLQTRVEKKKNFWVVFWLPRDIWERQRYNIAIIVNDKIISHDLSELLKTMWFAQYKKKK